MLDRYLSRLTQEHQLREAIAVYRREIDRNPDDPGLYARLALFVEQNKLDADVEQTYRAAFKQFNDTTWASKLARFYLRRKQFAAYQKLAQDVTGVFKGADLAAYLTDVSPNAQLNPVLYRQINLYAHQRFPHNLLFVRNLLTAYATRGTADPAAYLKLLRKNWFYDAGLRARFLEYLSSTGKLAAELSALPTTAAAVSRNDVAALSFSAEGHAWLTQYETAAPAFVAIADLTPGDRDANGRAAAVERSLAPTVPHAFDTAIRIAEQDIKAAPDDRGAITRVGEIYGDRELFQKAAPWWDRLVSTAPGLPDAYLETASVFWDYFRYDDALRIIEQSRTTLHQTALFAYEAGAIYENKQDEPAAVTEYIKAALETPVSGSNGLARTRLIRLARRSDTSTLVEQRTTGLLANSYDPDIINLRVAILENQGRRDDIHRLLDSALPRINQLEQIDTIRQTAARFGFDDTNVQALERVIALSTDPIEKLHAGIDLADFYEAHQNLQAAEHELTELLAENPASLGVIRANVDFYWREKEPKKAVATLVAAAGRAQQPYKNQLTREGAQKATDSGDFAEARTLLDMLLAANPFDGDLLAAKAATYAGENDENGLLAFYSGAMKSLQSASLPNREKSDRTAALRRGYVNALTSTKRYDQAQDQYVEILKSYPEDENLVRQVARFAESHGLTDKLLAYFRSAAQASPRDYRWPLVLARIETALRQYSQAIPDFEKAAYIRPDRSDILVAKADLETRLLRFAEALRLIGNCTNSVTTIHVILTPKPDFRSV